MSDLRRIPVAVPQRPAETLVASDRTCRPSDSFSCPDQTVVQPLVIAFPMVVDKELADRRAQRFLTEKDHALEAFAFQFFVGMSTLPLQFLILTVAGWISRNQQDVIDYLREENRILREHVGGRRLRFTDAQRRRLASKAKKLSRKTLVGIAPVVTPDTSLRWYRKLVARKYDGSKGRKVGRPRTGADIERPVVQMARENRSWGYTRIRGALRNLGHEIGRNTIKLILTARGIEPAATRRKGMFWEKFLKVHWGAIAAADFFTVETLTRSGLVRFLVFFVMELKSRRIRIAGIAPGPEGRWMRQMARNPTDAYDGFLVGTRYLIHRKVA